MQIWPAIDLLDGKCVRLKQGDYGRRTDYSDDPGAMARRWVGEGADCLHLVDLDGAREGTPVNREAIRSIIFAVDVPCELGGGLRDEASIAEALELGLARLVIGTRAVKDPQWFREMCRKFPDRLALGIDAKAGRVATDGWVETTETNAAALARQFADEPLAAIIYTDIDKDGMLAGPNLEAMRDMAAAVSIPVIASGGVATAADVAALSQTGVAGCIIGRALYEGTVTLADALSAAAGET